MNQHRREEDDGIAREQGSERKREREKKNTQNLSEKPEKDECRAIELKNPAISFAQLNTQTIASPSTQPIGELLINLQPSCRKLQRPVHVVPCS